MWHDFCNCKNFVIFDALRENNQILCEHVFKFNFKKYFYFETPTNCSEVPKTPQTCCRMKREFPSSVFGMRTCSRGWADPNPMTGEISMRAPPRPSWIVACQLAYNQNSMSFEWVRTLWAIQRCLGLRWLQGDHIRMAHRIKSRKAEISFSYKVSLPFLSSRKHQD